MKPEIKRGDKFNVGEKCPASGVYRLSCKENIECCSEEQREIPLAKGHRFPPCKNCKCPVRWEYVRRA